MPENDSNNSAYSKYYPQYEIKPPERTDQMENQLILNIVVKGRSSLTREYYVYINGLVVDDGKLQEVMAGGEVHSPYAVGKAVLALIDKRRTARR